MYHDFVGREVEDLEMDNMRRDATELPKVALLILPCSEQAAHGGDCWNVETSGGDVVDPHVTYADAYYRIYGVEPEAFDPYLED